MNDTQPAGRTAVITDDGVDWLYLVERDERREFKSWATAIFAGGMNCKRLVGRWPNYTVKQQ